MNSENQICSLGSLYLRVERMGTEKDNLRSEPRKTDVTTLVSLPWRMGWDGIG